jgi:hypothetical protein
MIAMTFGIGQMSGLSLQMSPMTFGNRRSHSLTENVTPNVTTETAIQQGFQASRDKSDVCDMSSDQLSTWVGQSVRKRDKTGWRGQVTGIDGSLAVVHWYGDPAPSRVNCEELELVKDAA